MDINNLTVGQLKEIAKIAAGLGVCETRASAPSAAVGKYCIVRTFSAGVHAGEVVAHDGDIVTLKNARRLWSWTAKSGVALSGVAINGLKSGKVDTMTPEHVLVGAIELIPCSETAKESINGA